MVQGEDECAFLLTGDIVTPSTEVLLEGKESLSQSSGWEGEKENCCFDMQTCLSPLVFRYQYAVGIPFYLQVFPVVFGVSK